MLEIDISDNEVLGPVYNRGLADGRREGLQKGNLDLVRRQIERKFGALPPWAESSLSRQTSEEIEQIALRLLDSTSLDDLLNR